MLGMSNETVRIWFGIPDERTTKWPIVGKPYDYHLPVLIVATYLALIFLTCRMMRRFQPFSLKRPLLLYNFFITLMNMYIFYEIVMSSVLQPGFNVLCQPVDRSNKPNAVRMASVLWVFYVSKIVDFSDTFFIILRHKWNQLSFLHVYHHCTIFSLYWFNIQFGPGGWAFYSCLINSFVHTVMYSYYFLAALGPQVAKYLWWKRYVTQLQMFQFVTGMTHCIIAYHMDCGYPAGVIVMNGAYTFSLFILFGQFYVQAYSEKPAEKLAKKPAVSMETGAGDSRADANENMIGNEAQGEAGDVRKRRP